MVTIRQLLELVITRNASDLHLIVGSYPMLRLNGELIAIQGLEILTERDMEDLIFPVLSNQQKKIYQDDWELDFGLDFESRGRFRANIYRQKGTIGAAFRLIPMKIKSLEEIGLPTAVTNITNSKQGLVLVTGPTGQGKTTTLAAFINQINLTRSANIITVEDPIEFVYPRGKSLISQRELNFDTKSWGNALKSALREDPDVVLIGEMRDLETISAAMTIAETGHLVFATLHTNSAAQTIDRIIDVFPVNQQPQIRVQLAAVLEMVISQRLVPTIAPGRALAAEVLMGVSATKSLIREGKTYMIDNLIQTSAEMGMMNIETALANLVKSGKVSANEAQNYALNPNLFNQLISSTDL